jgi:hypothetical protein
MSKIKTIGWLLLGGTIVNIVYNILLYSVPNLHWIHYTLLSCSFTTAVMSVLLYYDNAS